MSHTRMATLAVIFSELFPLDHFRCNFVSSLQLEYPLEYDHNTLQLYRTSHDSVSRKRVATLAFILSELFLIDDFRCDFVSAP